jgi:hypothetical protein
MGVQVSTGLELDANGGICVLDHAAWQQRRWWWEEGLRHE